KTIRSTAERGGARKITDRAAAPAPAASVNSQAGAGGAFAIALIVSSRADGARRPAPVSSIACIAETTRAICTPVGALGRSATSRLTPSVASRTSSPKRATIVPQKRSEERRVGKEWRGGGTTDRE